MAYWGEAYTQAKDPEAARSVLGRLAPTRQLRLDKAPTPRERAYMETIEILVGDGPLETRRRAYSEAMGRLAARHPEDLEAAMLHALAVRSTCDGAMKQACKMRAASIAEAVLRVSPRHVGAAAFLVRTYDGSEQRSLGLRGARVWANYEPAHHKPSHIFLSMGLWEEAAASNLACVEKYSDLPRHVRHCSEFASYARLQQGRYGEARELDTSYHHWARYIVETRQWELAASKLDTAGGGLPSTTRELFVRGWSSLQLGDEETAREALRGLEALRMAASKKEPGGWERKLASLILFNEDKEGGIELMTEVVALEQSRGPSFRPVTHKPTRELFGEMLLEVNRPEEAREQFELALSRVPRRALSLAGLARARAESGDHAGAQHALNDLVEMWRNADPELPLLKELERTLATMKADWERKELVSQKTP